MSFFDTPAGVATFTVIAVAVFIFIIELNYKYFAKYALDFIFALVFSIVLSPLWSTLAVISKVKISKRGGGRVFITTPCLGAKAKTVPVTTFALAAADGTELGAYSKFLKRSGFYKLPMLFNVLTGKLSFVGIVPLPVRNRYFIEDDDYARFGTRAGIFSPLAFGGDDEFTYEQVFKAECKYVKRRELFYDCGVVIKSLASMLSDERKNVLGEAQGSDYCEVLLARGEITQEQITTAESESV